MQGKVDICGVNTSRLTALSQTETDMLLRRAREMTPPAKCVFTLTKRPEFFRNLGFRLAPKEDFPAKIWTDCRLCPKDHCCDETALRREP